MALLSHPITKSKAPHFRDVIELLKPITWFPPMWAFMCGVVSSGISISDRWQFMLSGMILAGPLVCGTSQAVNDWYDRHVDAINQPERPIPSGRIAGQWGLYIAIAGTALSLMISAMMGLWVLAATIFGLCLAWGYSAPPLRLKMSGWWGPAAVALCYEGLTWFTGATVMVGGLPHSSTLIILTLYTLGAHGIMTLNDFKAVAGDRQMGIKSLPVTMGVSNAARFACLVMVVPQAGVVGLLLQWALPWHAAIITVALIGQIALMPRLLKNPAENAPWYGGTGVTLYVLGMLVSAFGIGTLA
ncbi:MAG: chlorophyll synthase ChlG [Sphingomonadaceae bacterium]